jgi:hypothetical protein
MTAASRRETRKYLSEDKSKLCLSFLEGYLSGKKNRVEATCLLLGCSRATATRLTNRNRPYSGRVKWRWAEAICAATGEDLHRLKTAKSLSFARAAAGWAGMGRGSAAYLAASNLGAAAVNMGRIFGLDGGHSVEHRGGEVTMVEVRLRNPHALEESLRDDATHRLVIFTRGAGDRKTMWFKHVNPSGYALGEGVLTADSLERTIKHIYDVNRKYTNRLAKKLDRSGGAAGAA